MVAQQVVLVTQELFLAEVINTEIVYAVQLIVSQASPGGSSSPVADGSPFGLLHQLLDSDTAAYGYCTAGHHIAPAFQAQGIGDCYGCSCPSQGTGLMFAGEVTHQRFASGPGPVDVFRVRS